MQGNSYLVTSGALTGRTFFLRASIQLRRMPEVIADRVKTASFVCNREAMEASSAPSRGTGSSHLLSKTPRHPLVWVVNRVREATHCLKDPWGQVEGWEWRCSLWGSPLHILHETISKQRQKKLCQHIWQT